jgi:GT2 family glycosyltransferase
MKHVIITSYNEPKATVRAVNTFLRQLGKDDKITVVDPFPDVERFISKEIKDKRVDFFLDPGEGKAYALNLLFQDFGTGNEKDLWILSDGDVHVSDNAVKEITNAFKDKKVGCVTGKPVALHEKRSLYEYWSWVAFAGIDKARERLSR